MRILNKDNSVDEIVNTILQKARYQKVVLCIDEDSDMDFIDKIVDRVGKEIILLKYYYNNRNVLAFDNIINNGVRIVIYNLKREHFYKLNDNNNYTLKIFIPQDDFILPYITCSECVYGDNLLAINTSVRDYLTLLFMYQFALNKVWALLLQHADVDTSIFKNIDAIANGKINFYDGMLNQIKCLQHYVSNKYQDVDFMQLPYYIYLQLCATLKLLETLNKDDEQYIDFFKIKKSSKDISKAHNLIMQTNIIDTLKFHSQNLSKLNIVILTRIKILIKKYFNFKNIKINKLNKIIKNQSKTLNIDNLLYISHIFNAI